MIFFDAESESRSSYLSELSKIPLARTGISSLVLLDITCLISRLYFEANSKSL